jgi:O-antigen/teichoic acid export membrane protein
MSAETQHHDHAAPAPSGQWRTDTFVAVATVIANLLGYGFNLIMSHALGPSGFGELGALLGVALVASVPGTAMQAFIARRIAQRNYPPDGDGRLLWQSVQLAVGVGLIVLVSAPALRAFLHIGSWAALVWLAALLVPSTVAFGCQGVLQGRHRFHALGVVLVLVQAARFLAGCGAALLDGGVATSLALATVLTGAVVLLAVPATGRLRWAALEQRTLAVLARDAGAVLGVLVLANLDLLLARHYLPHHEAGLYAGGNLITKAAFWGPSFIATVTYPRLTSAHRRAITLRRGAVLLAGLGGLGVALAAACAPLVPLLLGQAYEDVASLAWLFAAQGALLAGVLFGVYAGLAVHDRRLAVLVWCVTIVQTTCIVLWWHGSVVQILVTMVGGSLILVSLAATLEGPNMRRLADQSRQERA